MDEKICLTCKHWQPKAEGVGFCFQYQELRFQYEGPRFETVQGEVLQFECFKYTFGSERKAWKDRRLQVDEADRIRREHDATYEKMRYERIKEHSVAYWQKVQAERKVRLDQIVGWE